MQYKCFIVNYTTNYTIDCCVGYNHFNFHDFYKTMAKRGHSRWIESGRIHLGVTAPDRRLDAMLAVQERTTHQMDQASKDIDKLSREVTRVLRTTTDLANWGRNQRKTYEDLVCAVLKHYLGAKGYENVEVEHIESHRKTQFFMSEDRTRVDSVEWDGLISCSSRGADMLFLLEAKKTQSSKEMLKMPERVGRTEAFIKACTSGSLPGPGASKRFKTLCYSWSVCSGRKVKGVLAADVIPESALEMAVAHGYLTIQSGSGAFEVKDLEDNSSAVVPDEELDLSDDESDQ